MTATALGKDVTGEVMFLARELKAPVIAQTFTAPGDQAREQGWSHEEYLAAVLGRQVASRASNGTRMRISAAHLPQVKTLEDFTFSHVPSATRDVIAHLARMRTAGRASSARRLCQVRSAWPPARWARARLVLVNRASAPWRMARWPRACATWLLPTPAGSVEDD
jgi:IstB-like ATP binding protein